MFLNVHTDAVDFDWLSAPKPIVPRGTPFVPDLQAWTRDEFLDPDWMRVGTDIVGGTSPPTFNMTFSLDGVTVPEPSSFMLLGCVGLLIAARLRRIVRSR
ncbi:MAG TPA: PEP-CTERM sorting domain-containing protein [Candidatus Solibacter sp.]|nr:PEP-CTERM sorting domain-containing protein [Candidatus Solibacter sp.]